MHAQSILARLQASRTLISRGCVAAFAVVFTSYSSQALALISAEAGYVIRSGEMETKSDGAQDLGGSDIQLGVHLDPIPLIPISFGVSFNLPTYEIDDAELEVVDIEGLVITPELRAWLPIPGIPLTPFVRIGYAIGAYKLTLDPQIADPNLDIPNYEATYSSTGLRYGVGVKWKPLPLPLIRFNVVAALSFGEETFEDQTGRIVELPDSVPVPEGFDGGSYSNMQVLIGLEVGF